MDKVAVTDLFSLAYQCPHQVIRPHTDQSAGRELGFLLLLKNYFSSPFWKSASRTESTRPAKKKDFSPVACNRNPSLTIFTEDNCYHRYPLKKITVATSYAHKRTNTATCNTLKNKRTSVLPATLLPDTPKETFLILIQVYFCHKNKPKFCYFVQCYINIYKLTYIVCEPPIY